MAHTLRELELESELRDLKRENYELRMYNNIHPGMSLDGMNPGNAVEVSCPSTQNLVLAASVSTTMDSGPDRGLEYFGWGKSVGGKELHVSHYISGDILWGPKDTVYILDRLNEALMHQLNGELTKLRGK